MSQSQDEATCMDPLALDDFDSAEQSATLGDIKFVYNWGKKGSDDGEFDHPNGIAIGMDGTIYISDSNNHRIQCFQPSGTFIRKWKSESELFTPQGMDVGVCNGSNPSILRAMLQVKELVAFPPGLLSICLAYTGEECLVVTDNANYCVHRFHTNGTFINKWGSKGYNDGQFIEPIDCSVDKKGVICVADVNYRVQAFDMNGTFIRKWQSKGGLSTISASADGIIYISDCFAGDIKRYECDGTYIDSFVPSPDTLKMPWCVLVGNGQDEKTVYISELQNHCILQYDLNDRTLVRRLGSYGRSDGQFISPTAMAKTSDDSLLYVVDHHNHRVVALRL